MRLVSFCTLLIRCSFHSFVLQPLKSATDPEEDSVGPEPRLLGTDEYSGHLKQEVFGNTELCVYMDKRTEIVNI